MTDGNTYAINKHLDDQEDFDALQKIYADLEQAEARIEELEAKLAKAVEALEPFAFLDSETPQEAWDLSRKDLFKDWISFEEIYEARTTLAELKGQDDE